jgi:hypothetical protein
MKVWGQSRSVVPTILLVGIDELDRIPEFLNLGFIVVVSPDPTTLRRWQLEHASTEPLMESLQPRVSGSVGEMDSRRITR